MLKKSSTYFNFISKLFVIFLGLIFSNSALSQRDNSTVKTDRWVASTYAREYPLTVSLQNSSARALTIIADDVNRENLNLHKEIDRFYTIINGSQDEFKDLVRNAVKGSGLDYKSASYSIGGKARVRLSANSSGLLNLVIDGLSLRAKGKAEYSFLLDAKLKVATDNFIIKGTLNPRTGKVTNISFPSKLNVDTDFFLFGIQVPIIDDLADTFIKGKIAKRIKEEIKNLGIVQTKTLNDLIPRGMYLYSHNGKSVDVGEKLQNIIIDAISGESIQIEIDDVAINLRASPSRCFEPGETTFYDGTVAEIVFSDNLTLVSKLKVKQNCRWNDLGGQHPDF